MRKSRTSNPLPEGPPCSTRSGRRALFFASIPCLSLAVFCAAGCTDEDGVGPDEASGGGGKAGSASSGKAGSGAKSSGDDTGDAGSPRGSSGQGGDARNEAGAAGEAGTGPSGSSGTPGAAAGGASASEAGGGGGAGSGAVAGLGGAGIGGATLAGVAGVGGLGGTGGGGPIGAPIITAISSTGHDRFYGVTYDASGNIYAVGQITSSTDSNADIATVVAKFTALGVPDPTFGAGGFVVRNMVSGTSGELFRGIVVQSTGKVVVSGSIEHVGATDTRDRDIAVARFNSNGTKDTMFGTDGIVTLDLSTGVVNGTAFVADSAWGLAAYADDRLVVSGGQLRTGALDTDFALVRLKADGTRDTGFGSNGVFSFDTQVNGVSNNASPRNVTILPGTDGVIGAGYQPIPGADTAPVVYKVNDAGVLDTTFGSNGAFVDRPLTEQTECYSAVVQPIVGGGYKLVTTGYGRSLSTETTDLVSLRLTSAGKLDTTYGVDGLVRIDVGGFGDNSRNLRVLPDRRVLLVGGGRATSANVDGVVVLLTPDGAPYTPFSNTGFKLFDLGGPADFLWAVGLSPDNKTAAIAGVKGVGTSPMPPSANDDSALLLLPIPQ